MTTIWGMDENAVYLSPAPLYHSAPLFYCMSTMRLGGTVDRDGALRSRSRRSRCIEKYHVTHSQWVPTMFVRMLKLPDEVRNRYDLSSQKVVLHAAAPCSVETKRKMIEWWGPIIDEYYAATEGTGATYISSARLARAPRLGRAVDARPDPHPRRRRQRARRRARSAPCGSNRRPTGPASSTTRTRRRRATRSTTQGWSTVGDMGYLDADGYLYLTDRRTFMIVSGGVNIYPQEAENLLIDHPKVYDVAVFGIPDPEMGERVHGVVQPTNWDDAGPELERELLAYCSRQLAHYKCPQADRLRPRAPARADRQALQAAAPRPLLGRQDVAHRLKERSMHGPLLASGRDGDIFEFAPGPRAAQGPRRPRRSSTKRARSRTSREHGYPVPRHRRGARRRHRDRDGAHRRPDDDGRDGAPAVDASARYLPDARRPPRPAARDPRARLAARRSTTATGSLHLDLHPMNVMMSPSRDRS